MPKSDEKWTRSLILIDLNQFLEISFQGKKWFEGRRYNLKIK